MLYSAQILASCCVRAHQPVPRATPARPHSRTALATLGGRVLGVDADDHELWALRARQRALGRRQLAALERALLMAVGIEEHYRHGVAVQRR